MCGLIFIHAFEREMGIANTGNHLAHSEMYFWESGFCIQQGSNFLEIQVSGKWWFFSHWEFKHMEICSPQALSVLHVTVKFVIFKTPELAVEALKTIS